MEIVLSPFQNRAQPKCIRSQNANQYSFHIYFRKSANGNKMSCSLCTFPTCPPSSSVPCPTADCGQIFCCQDHLNRWVRYLQFARPVVVKKVWSRVCLNFKKLSKSCCLLIYFVPTWVKAISAKKMIFFAFSSLGHHFEKNGPCSRENEVKISKNRFLAIKSCRNMLQPSS